MNHTFNHPQGHLNGAFRPRLLPTQSQSAAPPPSASSVRVTTTGDRRVTTTGDVRVIG